MNDKIEQGVSRVLWAFVIFLVVASGCIVWDSYTLSQAVQQTHADFKE